MDRLTYPRKFLLISVLFGIPLALATHFLFGEINGSLEIARRQVVGLRYLEASQPLFRRIQEHMEEEIAPLRGEAGEARRQRQLAEITEAFAVLARAQRELGPILNSAQRFGTVKSNVETLTYELSRPGASARSAWRWRCAIGSRSSPCAGRSSATSSTWASASRRATRPSGPSASKDAGTTAPSAR